MSMKKMIQIVVGIIALGLLVVIVKENFFTSEDSKSYRSGWEAYENKQPELAIFNFNHVDKEKHPDVLLGLGSSYLNIGDYGNAVQHLQEAYNKNYGKGTLNYDKLLIALGMSYLYKGDIEKAKVFLKEARQNGKINTKINFQILDSIEHSKKVH